LQIHKDPTITITIQVLHVALIYVCSFYRDTSVKRLVYDFARQDVFKLGANESWSLARLDVLKLNHCPELSIDV
jgi:hypothetical protein